MFSLQDAAYPATSIYYLLQGQAQQFLRKMEPMPMSQYAHLYIDDVNLLYKFFLRSPLPNYM